MKNKNFIDSFNNSVNGIIYTIKNEKNMKFHMFAAILVLIMCFVFQLKNTEILIVCLTVGCVLVSELFNTAVEVIIDIIVDVYHPKAKIAKDVAAGAVLISAFVAAIVGYFIFFDKICVVLEFGITKVKQSPMNITVIAIILTMITVLILKTIFRKGQLFHGGMPSGHSALAFAVTTAIALWSTNIKIAVLSLIVSLLVVQSRYEGKIHTIFELIVGAILGTLITLLLFQIF